jgi:hypothetical protein
MQINAEAPQAYQRQFEDVIKHSASIASSLNASDSCHSDKVENTQDLTGLEFDIVRLTGERVSVTGGDIANALSVQEEKAKYYLDQLAHHKHLLDWTGNMNRDVPDRYRLSHSGRALLVKRGVFD